MTSDDHTLKMKNQVDTKLLYVTSLVFSEVQSTSDEVMRHIHKVVATPLAVVEAMIWPRSLRKECLPSVQRPRSALAIPGDTVDPASS